MRILFVGPLWYGGTCLQRLEAMKDLGHEVMPVDTEPAFVRTAQESFFYRIRRKLLGHADLAGANRQIVSLVKDGSFSIVWIDKGLTIEKETLAEIKRRLPGTAVAAYLPDDIMNVDNQSRQFLGSIPYYDLCVTANHFNLKELDSFGARDVLFIGRGFCPHVHHTVVVSGPDRKYLGAEAGFIGTFENERAESIAYLARHGIRIKIWGRWPVNWAKKNGLPTVEVMGRELWGGDLTRAIASFDINLNFLRKVNRDCQTSRSVVIPACGAFMLAERSEDHLALFREGEEAEFFANDEELLEKTRYYLENEAKRKLVAEAGRRRALTGGYSNQDRLDPVLKYLEKKFVQKSTLSDPAAPR